VQAANSLLSQTSKSSLELMSRQIVATHLTNLQLGISRKAVFRWVYIKLFYLKAFQTGSTVTSPIFFDKF
jgi:hypothetical protein